MQNHKLKISIILTLIIILGFFLFFRFSKNDTTIYYSGSQEKLISQNEIPVTIDWKKYSINEFGISFTYPEVWKVTKVNNDIWEVGAITIKVEHLSCNNPEMSKPMNNPITIYGFKTQIDEPKQTAYICNNTKTACLDIFSNNTKMSEEFYHGFISTLNISKEFDNIECYK